VSVVIPSFNGEKYIEDAIRSVLSNSSHEFDIEIIVSINASTDRTLELVNRFSNSMIRTLSTSSILSVEANWTKACMEARGDYIKLLCDDDLLTNGSLQKEVRLLDAHDDAIAVVSRRSIITPNGLTILKHHGFKLMDGVYEGTELIRHSFSKGTNLFGEPGCVLFRREEMIRELPWRNELPFVIDLEFYIRVFYGKKVIFNEASVMKFRLNSSSTSFSIRKSQSTQFLQLFDRYAHELKLDSSLSKLRARIITKKLEFFRGFAYLFL
jgi:glycosyltransferase involved in cell wall biosynthesis